MKIKRKLIGSVLVLSLPVLLQLCTPPRSEVVQRDAQGKIIVNRNPSTEPLTPEESLKRFHLPEGYRIELVASEPLIHSPVAITFDGNGRMFVAEMNTYMRDIDGENQMDPICTVKMLEDTNGDGKMDKSVVFIDSLVLPRLLLALDDRILVAETNSNNIYSYRDTDGDQKADEKIRVYHDDRRNTSNLEHQKSGLIWNLDNRMYVTYDNIRYRYEDGMLQAEELITGSGGQWGIAKDNYGRLFYSSAGGERPALDFQQNPYFGRLDIPEQVDEVFQAVWPIISTPDVQGGLERLRADSTLNHFTACGGQSVFRGTALPADAVGDLFIPEPVGRLIRRAKVHNTDGFIHLENAYHEEEFLASTDMNFRPINSMTGPDGSLYVVDMYHGIIQESNWTRVGTYLREQILNKKLDKNIAGGRIYRIVHDGIKRDETKPNLLDLSSEQLLPYLSHPNGWWRDQAQKLLVLRKNPNVVTGLETIVSSSENPLARIHAIWTLDGMGMLKKEVLKKALKDSDATVRKNAVWVAETLVTGGDEELIAFLEPFVDDPSADVRFQLALSLRFSESKKAKEIESRLLAKYPDHKVLQASHKKHERYLQEKEISDKIAEKFDERDRKLLVQGTLIYRQLCSTCHGQGGQGVGGSGRLPAPPLASNKRVSGDAEKLIRIMLHGLKGPIDGVRYTDEMPALGANKDDYIASVLSYIRNDMGNEAPMVHREDVRRVRKATEGRDTPWTWEELHALKE